MHKIICLTALFLTTFGLENLNAQQQRFKAGIIAGINASQVDGDDLAGWDKLGLRTGVRATALINPKFDLGFDILYSQRGASSKNVEGEERQHIRLRYLEVPLTLRYKDWLITNNGDDFHRVNFYIGASYGRLISYEVTEFFRSPIAAHAAYFNKSDVTWIAGVTYFVNRNLGISASYNGAINRLYNPAKDPTVPAGLAPVKPLRGKFWAFECTYMF